MGSCKISTKQIMRVQNPNSALNLLTGSQGQIDTRPYKLSHIKNG